LQKAGGSFTLTAEVDFGATYGLKSAYFKSRGTNTASTGEVRLANNEVVSWRDQANTANLSLKVNASDILEFNGAPVVTLALGSADTALVMNAGGTAYQWSKLTNNNIDASAAIAYSKLNLATSIVNGDVSNSAAIAYSKLNLAGSIVNADVATGAAIAYSKLALTGSVVDADVGAAAAIALTKLAATTASRALVSDGSGFVSASSVTSTELGYLSGVTSALQTQLDAKASTALSNLASVAINTSLISDTNNTDDLGSDAIEWKDVYAHAIKHGDAGTPALTISTTSDNGDINIDPHGTGKVAVPAPLEVSGTSSYVKLPSLTTAERDALTPADGQAIYNSSSGRFEGRKGGAWAELGGGTSGINYITNPDAEAGVTGWETYADAAAATPADGTGGSPNVTWTQTTSSPLRGSASFLFTKDAANRQGQGVAAAFTVPAADLSQLQSISFTSKVASGTYAAGDLTVYIYDVTNGALITPSQTQIADGLFKYEAIFTGTTATSYRLIIHVASTSASAYTVQFDDFRVGPDQAVFGPSVGSWETYTPTLVANGSKVFTNTARWRRVGDSMEIQFHLAGNSTASGSAASTTFEMRLPTGYTIDSSIGIITPVGHATTYSILTASQYDRSAAVFPSTDYTGIRIVKATTAVSYTIADLNVARGMEIDGTVTVPIAEWAGDTTHLAAARVEYAYNSDVTATASVTASGTTYGPGGVAFSSNWSSNTLYTRRVAFQSPIQQNDVIELEVLPSGSTLWMPIHLRVGAHARQNTVEYGPEIVYVDANNINVRFHAGGVWPSSTYAANGLTWSNLSADKWRVRKSSPHAPAGVQLATSSTPGLIGDPVNMSDSIATMLGQKEYNHGTTYNGGDAPTITYNAGGGSLTSVELGTFIPYKTQAGVWRLRFSIKITVSSTARTSLRIAVNGITFPNAYSQVVHGTMFNAATHYYAYAINNTNQIELAHASSTSTAYAYSGDVVLASKPTWAY
jgi:hypothetical protein